MWVEDERAKNAIFHQVIALTINVLIIKRWKMEDRNTFSVREQTSIPNSSFLL
ncbi:hypothetical protein M123_4303 [Bacteroides fragilis str. 3976T8]|uniref:Uncharacterized protein n=1 Tax=Bacteroides fragilis str. 3976T8 TaxID=1339314 RepID=A0A016E2S8_BACFG|nr:hypothetical protein M123_4303 [Bacteroides fragilis str. 3976T8]